MTRIKLNFAARWCLLLATLLVLGSIGCGGGSGIGASTTNPSPVIATQNPLVAEYNVASPNIGTTAWVEFGPTTSYGRQTSATLATTVAWQPANILVAGMLPNTTYHMRAHKSWNGGTSVDPDQTFTTGSLPTAPGPVAPKITITRPNPSLTPQAGVELFSNILTGKGNVLQAIATDLSGNIIWYYLTPTASPYPIKLMSNGHFIVNLGQVANEIDLAGNTVRTISVPGVNQSLQAMGSSLVVTYMDHDILPLANGHWILLCNTTKDFTNLPGYNGTTHVLGDALVDIDPNGNAVWAWSTFDHLDVNRHPFGLADFEGLGADWTHGNAVVYMPDGNLLMSLRNQSWLLKIDYADGMGAGDVLWKLGEGGDFTLSGGDPSQWFYAQHYPNILSTDESNTLLTLAVWDNGNIRMQSDGSECGQTPFEGTPCHSRATIFQVDEASKTATLLWQDLPGFFSYWGGSIGVLPNGNVEFAMSAPFGTASASQIEEVTQTDSPQIVWQLNINGVNTYRADRIPSLYPGVAWQQ